MINLKINVRKKKKRKTKQKQQCPMTYGFVELT